MNAAAHLDPKGLVALSRRYLSWLESSGSSRHTLNTRRSQLHRFVDWCGLHDVTRAADITRAHVEAYQRHLFHYRQKNGQPLSHRSQGALLVALGVWLRWLTKQHEILANPAADLELPRRDRSLPRPGFNVSEVEEVLRAIDTDSMLGLRDRAIFEMLYSAALRRSELCALQLYDVDRARGTVFVRAGKGGQDRVVPIGKRALAWLEKYLEEARPHLAKGRHDNSLWLTIRASPLRPNTLTIRASELVRSVAPEHRRAACHVFRHTAATLMLEGGADVRVIQEFLGHRHLDSTQVYTRVSVQHLKDVHEKTHPAKLGLTKKVEDGHEE